MKICSHTIVKNGMPFIVPIIERVLPYVDRALVTISRKSTDGTEGALHDLPGDKIDIDYEDVSDPGNLTMVRQMQVGKTHEDWILFLDDDDWWPKESLETLSTLSHLDADAFAFNPFQVLDKNSHDLSWRYKWFTKFFRNRPGVHYRKKWPRDVIFLNDKHLYWRENERVVRAFNTKFFHLSNIKKESFRNDPWAEEFKGDRGPPIPIPNYWKEEVNEIYEHVR